MALLESILVPLQIAFTAVWVYVAYLTFTRYRRFRDHGYGTIAHILRAVCWGEAAIIAETVRRLLMGAAQMGWLPQGFADAARSPAGMFPVFLLMAVAAMDGVLVFRRRRFEWLAEEHEARLQIGRLASRLHTASEALGQRNRELERANALLAEAESRFRDFFERAPLHYHTLDRSGRILDSNELELKDLGYRRDELVGQHISKLMHPDYLSVDQAALNRFWETGMHAGTEVVIAKKDGTPLPVRLYSTAVRDEKGAIVAARTIWIDIAAQKAAEAEVARKAAELEAKNRELQVRNQELSEVGHVISHDLKAPLRGVEAFLGFLEEDCGANLGPSGRAHIATIQDSCRRLRRMIDDLIEYARFGKVGQFERVSLTETLEEVVAGLRLNLQARRAEIQMAGDLPQVLGDRVQITAILRNLIDNALKYGPTKGLQIEIGSVPSDSAGQAVFFVRDNGIGIASEHQEKIFGLFQRLHAPPSFEGSGMGLAFVKKAVDNHGGKVWVESKPGKGSTFYVRLPAAAWEAGFRPRRSEGPAAGPEEQGLKASG